MTQMINLMPRAYRQKLGDHRVRRRFIIHLGVALAFVGLAAIQQRYVLVDRRHQIQSAGDQLKSLEQANAHLKQIADDATEVTSELAIYQRTALPIELSRVIGTVSALVPEGIAIDAMRTWIEETQLSRSALEKLQDRTQRNRGGKNSRNDARRVLMCEFTGSAESDVEISVFLENLENHSLFQHVQLDYSRTASIGSVEVREFRVIFEVDLEQRYLPQMASAEGGQSQ